MTRINRSIPSEKNRSLRFFFIMMTLFAALVIAGGAALYTVLAPEGKFERELEQYARERIVKVTAKDIGLEGSGFIISPDGLILTNLHLLSTVGFDHGKPYDIFTQQLTVTMPDGEILKPGVVAGAGFKLDPRNKAYDCILLKVNKSGLPCFTFGDSQPLLENVVVYFAGYLFNTDEPVMGKGKISDIFDVPRRGFRVSVAQVNNVQSGGFSGGPIFDLNRHVLGIMSMMDVSSITEIRAIDLDAENPEIAITKKRSRIFGDMISQRTDVGYAILCDPVVAYLKSVEAVR